MISAVLSRLDDPSAEVRLYAAQCIGELKLDVDASGDTDSWKIVAKHVFDSLILHLDGPEINFRQTLLGKSLGGMIERFKNKKMSLLIRIHGKTDGK